MIVRVKPLVTETAGDSLSVTVTLNVPPEPVGVPESTPAELSVKPGGSVEPVATDQ